MSSSDSSEDEDLSRFKDVVDTSFVTSIIKDLDKLPQELNPHSERHLDTSTHYNDIKVPDVLQKQISAKISAILNKTIEYVDVCVENRMEDKVEGGIKLFTDSKELLSHEENHDNYTENHNKKSKKIKEKSRKRQWNDLELEKSNEYEKCKSVVVSGQHIVLKEEIKYWKSRRKEKLFKYKTNGKSKELIAVE